MGQNEGKLFIIKRVFTTKLLEGKELKVALFVLTLCGTERLQCFYCRSDLKTVLCWRDYGQKSGMWHTNLIT